MNPHALPLRLQLNISGFTLLELLLAISLSTLLMTVLVIGLNQLTRDWEKHGNLLNRQIDESLLLLQLEKAILGTVNYRYKATSLAQQQLYFKADNHQLKWVSTVSPNRSSGLTVWQLKANDPLGLQIISVTAYPGDPDKQLEKYAQSEKDPVNYFEDYKVSVEILAENSKDKKDWLSSWSGSEEKQLPLAVRLIFKHKNESELDHQFELFSFIPVSSSTQNISQMPFGGRGTGRTVNPDAARGLFK